jgi:hypothetical protein
LRWALAGSHTLLGRLGKASNQLPRTPYVARAVARWEDHAIRPKYVVHSVQTVVGHYEISFIIEGFCNLSCVADRQVLDQVAFEL